MIRDTLRDKQNMEILDVFKNLRSQIVDRERKQIAVFPESVMPKTQRDLGVEVNADKGIETLNRILEMKLGSLEYFVQNINVENRGAPRGALSERAVILPYSQAYQQVTTTGDVVGAWNAIVRGYQTQGLSKQSQEIIKVKLQELKGNLEAMKYGLSSGVQAIFEHKIVDAPIALKILELLRALSVYTLISSQADSGMLEILNVESLRSAYKNIFESLSLEQIHILQQHSKAGSVIDTPIRSIPYFGVEASVERLKQIAEEIGFQPSQDLIQRLARLPQRDADLELNKIKNELGPGKAKFSEEESKIVSELDQLGQELVDVKSRIEEAELEKNHYENQAELLALPPVPVEPSEIVLPELPASPQYPERGEFKNDDDFLEAVSEYRESYKLHFEAMRGNLEARLLRENAVENLQRREVRRKQYLEQIEELEEHLRTLEELKEVVESRLDAMGDQLASERDVYSKNAIDAARAIVEAASGKQLKLHRKSRAKYFPRRVEPESDEEKHGSESGSDSDRDLDAAAPSGSGRFEKGKDLDTRGLSTMRAHYGTTTVPSVSKQAMHFDDTRNDNFCSRPIE